MWALFEIWIAICWIFLVLGLIAELVYLWRKK